MSTARVAIVGAGAIGGSVGSDLVRAGVDVTFVDQWPEHVEAMKANGLRVDLPTESLTIPVRAIHLCEVARLPLQPFDLVILTVKAYDVRWAGELIRPLLSADGLAVGIQNGLTMDDMASSFGPSRTLGAVVEMAANIFTPGVIERHTAAGRAWFALGPYDGSTRGREAQVVDVLKHAGTVQVTEDIRSAKWMKLVANSAEFFPSAILNLPLAEAVGMPEIRALMDAAGSEALQVALALDHRIVPMFGEPGIEARPAGEYAGALLDAIVSGFTLPTTRVAPLHD